MKKALSVIFAVVILALSVVPVFARNNVISPLPSIDYKIRVHNTKGGTGTYTTEKDKDGKHATITAHPKNGYTFDHWVIEGKYELEDGDLRDPELTILMKSDIDATPYFKPKGKSSASSNPPIHYDDGGESPKTGTMPTNTPQGGNSNFLYLIAGLFVIVIAGAGVKLASSRK